MTFSWLIFVFQPFPPVVENSFRCIIICKQVIILQIVDFGGFAECKAELTYRRVPKVAPPVTFGISRPEGPQLSGGRYFRVAVTFG